MNFFEYVVIPLFFSDEAVLLQKQTKILSVTKFLIIHRKHLLKGHQLIHEAHVAFPLCFLSHTKISEKIEAVVRDNQYNVT